MTIIKKCYDFADFKDVIPNNEKEVNNTVYKDTKFTSKFKTIGAAVNKKQIKLSL